MSLKGLPRWKGPLTGPMPKRRFIADINACDIPSVIESLIRHMPRRCLGISLRRCGGFAMMVVAEQAAAEVDIRIFWKGGLV